MAEYMDYRFLQSNQLRKVNRITGKTLKEDKEYCIIACNLNPDENFVKKEIIEEQKNDEEENDGGVIEVRVLDIPRIHNPNEPIAKEFIQALSELEDPTLFSSDGIKAITEFRWHLCYTYIVWR